MCHRMNLAMRNLPGQEVFRPKLSALKSLVRAGTLATCCAALPRWTFSQLRWVRMLGKPCHETKSPPSLVRRTHRSLSSALVQVPSMAG